MNLEIFDGLDARDMGWHRMDRYDLGVALREYTIELLEAGAGEGLALDYALAFVDDVNYREIADMMLSEYADESEDESEDETEDETETEDA